MPRSTRTPDALGGTRVVWAIIALSAIGAGLAACRPTGIAFFDVIERSALGAIVVWFAARSRPWTWVVLAGAALVFAGTIWGAAFALVALVAAVAVLVQPGRGRPAIGALVGAVGIQVLLRAAPHGGFGLSALVTAVTVCIVVVSGYRSAAGGAQRRVRRVGVGLIGFVVVAVAGFGVTTWRSKAKMESGLGFAQDGMASAAHGSQKAAGYQFLFAQTRFSEAHEIQRSPLVKLAEAVPLLSQHARLSIVAARTGADLSTDAFRTVTAAPYEDLRARDGTFDLERLASMRAPLAATIDSGRRSLSRIDAVTSPWLLGSVHDRVTRYRADLAVTIPRAQDALRALDVAPTLLGADRPRHYLVLFSNPAESRGLGGFIGAWAEIETDNGRVRLTRHGHIDEFNDAVDWRTRTISGPADYLARYSRLQPQRFVQNVSASPDLPTVAQVSEELYRQSFGTRLDGVLYVDPIALAAMLELTGPVLPKGSWYRIRAGNAADFLMHTQYLKYPGRTARRIDVLAGAAEATFEALTHGDLPPIRRISEVLSPMVRQGRLLFTANDPDANAYLASIGLTGAFPRPEGHDLLSVRISNASTNKVDYFLDQSTSYTVRYDPSTGATSATARVTFVNHAPAGGLPTYVLGNQDTRAGKTDGRPFGSDTLMVSVYSALRPTAITIDGKVVGVQAQRELGAWVGSQSLTIPPGGRAVFEVHLAGELRRGERYRLTIAPQASARPRHTTVVVQPTDPKGRVIPELEVTRSFDDEGVEHLSVPARPVASR